MLCRRIYNPVSAEDESLAGGVASRSTRSTAERRGDRRHVWRLALFAGVDDSVPAERTRGDVETVGVAYQRVGGIALLRRLIHHSVPADRKELTESVARRGVGRFTGLWGIDEPVAADGHPLAVCVAGRGVGRFALLWRENDSISAKQRGAVEAAGGRVGGFAVLRGFD